MDEWLTFNFSLNEIENEVGSEVCGQKASIYFKVLIKDLDPFLLQKISSTFISLILFFKLLVLFSMSLNLLDLRSASSEVSVAEAGNSHEAKWNLNRDVNSETWFEGKEEEISEDEEGLLLSGGKTFLVGGAFQGLLLGLKTVSDSAFEAKEDAIKAEVAIASWVFFFLR